MSFWRSRPGKVLLWLLLLASLALATGMARYHHATSPPEIDEQPVNFEAMKMEVETVSFLSTDGIELSGWLLTGEPERPAVILCHDFGTGKVTMLNLMIRLHESGFTVLTFDFRGHGASGGTGSTLGHDEKRDVLGAIGFLRERSPRAARSLGIYGVGMGAHAAVLAAADRPVLRVLVLDGLYPDVGYPLARRFFGGWSGGVKYLGIVPRSLFAIRNRSTIDSARAADLIAGLTGRHLLLIASAGDSLLAAELRRMYERIPEQRDADGNLITLPATEVSGLYGPDLERYHSRIDEFFEQRLDREF